MNDEKASELKEWLRENLSITIEPLDCSSNAVAVGLRFVGETSNFVSHFLYIPKDAK